MKHRSRHLILLRAILVVPFQQNVIVPKQFNDSADKRAGSGGNAIPCGQSGHAIQRRTEFSSSPNGGCFR